MNIIGFTTWNTPQIWLPVVLSTSTKINFSLKVHIGANLVPVTEALVQLTIIGLSPR